MQASARIGDSSLDPPAPSLSPSKNPTIALAVSALDSHSPEIDANTIHHDKQASNEQAELDKNKKQIAGKAIIVTVAYMLLGVLIVTVSEGWDIVDSFYFVIVTLTTVGYGDQDSWSNDGVTLFIGCYALFGMVLMSSALGIIAAHIIEGQEIALREAQRKIKEAQLSSGLESLVMVGAAAEKFKRKMSDNRLGAVSAGGMAKVYGLGSRIVPKFVADLFKSLWHKLLQLFTTLCLGMVLIYFDHEAAEDVDTPTFIQCFYFAVITGTTIGYGDLSPQTPAGRVIGIVYILTAVVSLGNVLGDIASHFVEAKKKEALEKVLHKRISMDDFSQFDLNGDGRINRAEFVIKKLMLMGILSDNDVSMVEREFDKMDMDGNGDITPEELKAWMEKKKKHAASAWQKAALACKKVTKQTIIKQKVKDVEPI
ncbi:hypothetical protein TrVE_jg7225 [Triparma verrucosa]|uniref:EF-hand domain-containing protein n=1 Tax=Triparma verrucosa TaxID=1606542 RepID=A0A9W7C3U2_9STRA|nr:hypothetical protein TrVE_jg7225 [Triparma verrucosa]